MVVLTDRSVGGTLPKTLKFSPRLPVMDQCGFRLPDLVSQTDQDAGLPAALLLSANSITFLQNVPLTTLMFLIPQPEANS